MLSIFISFDVYVDISGVISGKFYENGKKSLRSEKFIKIEKFT